MLEEIFKTNPGLLEAPEVQKLIAYVQEQHERGLKLNHALDSFNHRIISKVMHSEVMVIGGTPCRKVVEDILEQSQSA